MLYEEFAVSFMLQLKFMESRKRNEITVFYVIFIQTELQFKDILKVSSALNLSIFLEE